MIDSIKKKKLKEVRLSNGDIYHRDSAEEWYRVEEEEVVNYEDMEKPEILEAAYQSHKKKVPNTTKVEHVDYSTLVQMTLNDGNTYARRTFEYGQYIWQEIGPYGLIDLQSFTSKELEEAYAEWVGIKE